MRLLNIDTFQLEEFIEDLIPPYAILSHTWGSEEVALPDLNSSRPEIQARQGWLKIRDFCSAVARDNVAREADPSQLSKPRRTTEGAARRTQHVWVDTCCIDRTNNSELSEAINSMFRWYSRAVKCYVYLADVDHHPGLDVTDAFISSRWFKRGWTLQELLAPRQIEFYDKNWQSIGPVTTLWDNVASASRIDEYTLRHGSWRFASVARKMSWAAPRVTTRPEDLAYCLLGIFDIQMPLIYGEGLEKAFFRLQEEVLKESSDQSILAWHPLKHDATGYGAFAPSPEYFTYSGLYEPVDTDWEIAGTSNKGIQLNLPLVEQDGRPGVKLALLSCTHINRPGSFIGIPVLSPSHNTQYLRQHMDPVAMYLTDWRFFKSDTVFLARTVSTNWDISLAMQVQVNWLSGMRRYIPFRASAAPFGRWRSEGTTSMLLGPANSMNKPTTAVVAYKAVSDPHGLVCLVLRYDTHEQNIKVSICHLPVVVEDSDAVEDRVFSLLEEDHAWVLQATSSLDSRVNAEHSVVLEKDIINVTLSETLPGRPPFCTWKIDLVSRQKQS